MTTTFKVKTKKSRFSLSLNPAGYLILGSLAFLAILNSRPYIAGANALLATMTDRPFQQAVAALPLWATSLPVFRQAVAALLGVIAAIVGFFTATGGLILGFGTWAIVQGLQLLPAAIFRNEGRLPTIISGISRDYREFEEDENDPAILRKLKSLQSKMTTEWADNIYQASQAAFLLDFIVCSIYFKPLGDIQVFMLAPSPDLVDWVSVFVVLGTVLGYHFLFDMLLKSIEAQKYLGGGND